MTRKLRNALGRGDLMISLDLQDIYLHISVSKSLATFCVLVPPRGETCQRKRYDLKPIQPAHQVMPWCPRSPLKELTHRGRLQLQILQRARFRRTNQLSSQNNIDGCYVTMSCGRPLNFPLLYFTFIWMFQVRDGVLSWMTPQ